LKHLLSSRYRSAVELGSNSKVRGPSSLFADVDV